MHILTRLLAFASCFIGLSLAGAVYAYTPEAQQVTGNVYAIIGPLGQRNEANDGLNNNLGFIVADTGVILIDSGASRIGAERIERAIGRVSDKPVKWVINTGSQDHRWLGNDYFASKGAEIIAMARTAETQDQYAEQHLTKMQGFLNERFEGTRARPAERRLDGDAARLTLGGQSLELRYTDAHYPGDARLWLPQQSVVLTGDLVYVDRMLALLPVSSVVNGQQAFHDMLELQPQYVVPGHGGVSDVAKATRDCGDYYDFLVNTIGAAAEDMEPMQDTLDRYENLPRFRHLEHYHALHRANMNRTYLEFEQL